MNNNIINNKASNINNMKISLNDTVSLFMNKIIHNIFFNKYYINQYYYHHVIDISSRFYIILLSINILILSILCILSYGSVFMIFIEIAFGGIVIDHLLDMNRIQLYTHCITYIICSTCILSHIVINKYDNYLFKKYLVSWPDVGQFVLMIRWFSHVLQAMYIYTDIDGTNTNNDSNTYTNSITIYLYLLMVSQLCIYSILQFPVYCTYIYSGIDCCFLFAFIYQLQMDNIVLYICMYICLGVCFVTLSHFCENTGITSFAETQLININR